MALHNWESIDVTSSRRPILTAGESVIFVHRHVGLYNAKHKIPEYSDGFVYLTTHRICYVDSERPALRSIELELAKISKIEHYAGFLKSSPKITLWYSRSGSSSEYASGRNTPLSAAMVPAKITTKSDWICPICTFTNQVPAGYITGNILPPCDNCGMKPPKTIKISEHSVTLPAHKPSSSNPSSFLRPGSKQNVNYQNPPPLGLFPCPRCTFGNHPAITTCEVCGAPLISRNLPPKLHSNQNVDERGPSPALTEEFWAAEGSCCKLSFRDSGDKQFLEKLRRAVADQAWLQDTPVEFVNSSNATPAKKTGAGIGALQYREELLRNSDANTLSGAFEDLEGLMARAKEMVALAESFAQRLANTPVNAATSEAHMLIRESSEALGLSSPVVTKESVGRASMFHTELSRQIAEFLDGRLRGNGGAMTLVDLYAFYNRARKGSLISPDDLRAACQLFDELKLPIRLRRFKSGIVVVQDRDRTDASTRNMIWSWLKDRTLGASALDAAERFGWSVSVAREELEMVEEYGDIARDAGIGGIRFYDNKIMKWDWRSWDASQTVEPLELRPGQAVE